MGLLVAGYALTGVAAGLLAGLMGVGGGLVMVPALLLLFHWQGLETAYLAQMAVGTSLATIVPISLASLLAHHRHGAVIWPLVRWLAPGLILGAWAGAWLASQMSTGWLKGLFGSFLLLVAFQMATGFQPGPSGRKPGRGELGLVGSLIGLVSGLVGIGGGTMTVPYLAWRGTDLPKAVGTSAACGLPIALAGAAGFILFGQALVQGEALGFVQWPAVLVMAPLAVYTAPFGAALAHRLPVARLRRLFALVLVVVGVRLLWKVASP